MAVSLVFSILATGIFIYLGIKGIFFLMPFVIGWGIAAIAAPLVNWLEKKFNIVKKLGSALIVILVIGLIVVGIYFAVSRIILEVGSKIFPNCTRSWRVDCARSEARCRAFLKNLRL